MKTILVIGLLATAALAAVPATAEPNDSATYGLCNAWAHNENGREHGKAENSTAFTWLQGQAEDAEEESVEAYCSTVPHPGNGRGNGGGNGGGRP